MITLEQAKNLKHGDVLYSTRSYNRKGEPHRVKITGQVKTWKRNPNRVSVPWKHGLYGPCGYLTERDLADFCLTEEEALAERA